MRHLASGVLSALAIASFACKGEPPRRPAPAPGAPVAAAQTAPAAGGGADGGVQAAQPEWAYSSVGKRDPFRSFLAELQSSGGTLVTRCSTPLATRKRCPSLGQGGW